MSVPASLSYPPDLVDALRRRDLVLFIGAGLSMGAGLPSWPDLVRPWALAIGTHWPQNPLDLTAQHLLAATQHFQNQRGRLALIRKLREALTCIEITPSAIHRLVASLPATVLFTTNYDPLLELTYAARHQMTNVVVVETDLAFWSEGQIQIIKLCGDLAQPESIVITRDDFSTYPRTHSRLVERLRTTLESKTALFLGYSLQDPFFNQVWDNIGLDFGGLRRIGYAVLFHADHLMIEDFRRRSIHVIQLQPTGLNDSILLEDWLKGLTACVQAPPEGDTQPGARLPTATGIDRRRAGTAEAPTKILVLATNPKDTQHLRIEDEVRAMDRALRMAQFRDCFDIKTHWSVQTTEIQEYLLRYQPDIVHFSGHGSTIGELIFEDVTGQGRPVSIQALRVLFSTLKDNIRCVVLNACYSEPQARAIAEYVDCVIGISHAISDEAAMRFTEGFYQALGYGRSIQTAFRLGLNQMALTGQDAQDEPQLLALRTNASAISFI